METPIPADAANIESQPEASVRTPEHTPVAAYTEDAVQTPEPADSSEAEQYAAGSVPTPRPSLSPRLPDQSDYITPPPQILDGDEGPLSTVAHELQEQAPDEASVETLDSEVKLPEGPHPLPAASCMISTAYTEPGAEKIFVKTTPLHLHFGKCFSSVTLFSQAGHEAASAEVSSYVPRSKRTPFMERKLKALQVLNLFSLASFPSSPVHAHALSHLRAHHQRRGLGSFKPACRSGKEGTV